MAGIKEIAETAGVSISTVSYAMNNSDKITKETR
ncbi:MAG: LacI family DNA-binding transcriptional regulator, partial [Liquorilactobacillus satsumensis]